MNPIQYKIRGRGPAVVFLHGFCESSAMWHDFLMPFEENHTLITVDLPGFGNSQELELHGMEDMAQSISKALVQEKIEKFTLVGHSLGGYVALSMAEQFPASLSGLVLFHSTALEDSEEKKAARDRSLDFIQQYDTEAFIRPFVPPLFYSKNRERCKSAIDLLIDQGLGISKSAISKTLLGMKNRKNRCHVLKAARYPVLSIVGKQDAAVPLDNSLQFCHLAPQSHALFLEDVAHMGMFESKEITQQALQSFIHLTHP